MATTKTCIKMGTHNEINDDRYVQSVIVMRNSMSNLGKKIEEYENSTTNK